MNNNNNELNQKQQQEALMAENQKTADAPGVFDKLPKIGKKLTIAVGFTAALGSFIHPRVNGFDSQDNTKTAAVAGIFTGVVHKIDSKATKLIKDIHDRVSGPNIVQEHYQENTSAEQQDIDAKPAQKKVSPTVGETEITNFLDLVNEHGNTENARQLIKDSRGEFSHSSLARDVRDECNAIANSAGRATSVTFRQIQVSPDMADEVKNALLDSAEEFQMGAKEEQFSEVGQAIGALSTEYKEMGLEGRSASKLTGEQIIDHGLAVKLCAEAATQHIAEKHAELQEMSPGELVVTKLSHDGNISFPIYEMGYENSADAQKDTDLNEERAALFSQGARALDALYSQRDSMNEEQFNAAFLENTVHYENELGKINDQSIELQEKNDQRFHHLHDTVGAQINRQKILDEQLGLNDSIEKNEPEVAQVIDKSHEMEL